MTVRGAKCMLKATFCATNSLRNTLLMLMLDIGLAAAACLGRASGSTRLVCCLTSLLLGARFASRSDERCQLS